MLILRSTGIRSSEITPESVYLDRRRFLGTAALGAAAAVLGGASPLLAEGQQGQDKPNTWEDITTYNNFYEFGTGKGDPAENAHTLKPRPWTVVVEGLCAKPATYQLEDFIKPFTLEDRVYRHRCVEAWSMVIPWRGFPLRNVIERAQPTSDREVRGVHHAAGSGADARRAQRCPGLALQRGSATR